MSYREAEKHLDAMKARKYPPLHVGDVLEVIDGDHPSDRAVFMDTGDRVRVIEIYPHIVRVERIRPLGAPFGNNGKLTQSYPLKCWWLRLKKIGGA